MNCTHQVGFEMICGEKDFERTQRQLMLLLLWLLLLGLLRLLRISSSSSSRLAGARRSAQHARERLLGHEYHVGLGTCAGADSSRLVAKRLLLLIRLVRSGADRAWVLVEIGHFVSLLLMLLLLLLLRIVVWIGVFVSRMAGTWRHAVHAGGVVCAWRRTDERRAYVAHVRLNRTGQGEICRVQE